MKRGIGTIRQDVNISIRGGARTEIKGFQDLKSIPKVIEEEISRQQALIKKGKRLEPEVRKAMPDFSTTFLRPMPGAARMYPETDVPPIRPSVGSIQGTETIMDRAARYEKLGLGKDLAKALAKSEKSSLFDKMSLKNVKPGFIAETLVSYQKELTRDHMPCEPGKISDEDLMAIFSALDSGKAGKESVMPMLVDIAKGRGLDLSKYKMASASDVEGGIRKIVQQNKATSVGAIMGLVMKEYRGKADGKTISEMVNRILKE
jgi:glutamyl-tRNA(Gln) amidotransferase subunit E